MVVTYFSFVLVTPVIVMPCVDDYYDYSCAMLCLYVVHENIFGMKYLITYSWIFIIEE